MKKTLVYYFYFSIFIGTTIYLCEKMDVVLPDLFRFYVNDFLIIPIVLTIVLWVVRKSQNNVILQISFWKVVYICGFYSILFEFYLPKIHPRYTSDFVDVFLYFISGLLFYILQKDFN